MTPATLNAILNSAPMIIQAASKLINMIRVRETGTGGETNNTPVTLDGLKQDVKNLEARLDENYRSDVEQIRLIEQLARQNESLADTLKQTFRKVTVLTYVTLLALTISIVALLLLMLE
jgi:hypothetical protein